MIRATAVVNMVQTRYCKKKNIIGCIHGDIGSSTKMQYEKA